MRKTVLLGVLLSILCVWPSAAKAQGIEAGSQLASGYLGFGVPLQESGLNEEGTELDWGNVSASYGVQYMVFPSAYFGVGAEANGNNFSDAELDIYGFGYHEEVKSSMDVYNFMLAFRANVNPQSRVRFYIPFGAGLTSAKSKHTLDSTLVASEDVSGTSTSFGYFVGAGIEADLADSGWVLGGELRYSGFEFDKSKYDIPGVSGKENYSYLSFLFKVGYKF